MTFSSFDFNSPEESQAALELNERFIHRYYALLNRFGNLPGCEAIVYEKLKGEFPPEYIDALGTYTYLPPPGDPSVNNPPSPLDSPEDPATQEEIAKENEEANNIPEQDLPPQLRLMRRTEQHILFTQNAIYQFLCDWTNLYAAIIPAPQKRAAIQILMNAAGLIANTRSSIDQMAIFQFGMAFQLCRRASQIGDALLEQVTELQETITSLHGLLSARRPTLQSAVQELQETEKMLLKLLETPNDF